tara:strand:+ start:710 stop:1936 length:1227 start_codon:yes stop_codon:yes gene_type:complete
MTMDKHYDIIIVGGGPAGTSAALYAHKMGLKTIILDKNTFPRDKICGDALSGKSVKYMRELGVLDQVANLNGSTIRRITFGSPSHKQFDIHLNNPQNKGDIKEGYVIPREIYDNFLFEKAKEVTEIIENFNVNDLLYENNKIIGISGKHKKEVHQIYAPLILGCDGAKSTIARKLGFHTEDQENTAIAIRCYYEGVKGLTDQIELHFVDEVLPGYFWLFPAGDNIANIGLGLSKKFAKKDERKLSQILDEVTASPYFKDRFSDAKKLEKPKGWSLPLGRIQRPSYGDGFMLLGDAAGLIDPFTGEGIGNAMASAKFAVEVASEAKKNNDYSKDVLSKYHKLVWDELGSELRTSTKLQNLSNYRTLLNIVINKASRNKDIQDIISGMLTKEISKDKLSNPLFYLKVLFA